MTRTGEKYSNSGAAFLRYEEVAQDLRSRIAAGVLQPGDRLPSLRNLRQEYGITQATVDRAHALLEKEGLITRSQRSGVFVAEPKRKPRTGIIGFCGLNFSESSTSPYWSAILAGVREVMKQHDLQILLLEEESASGWAKVDGALVNTAWYLKPHQTLPPHMPRVYLLLPPSVAGIRTNAAERCVLSDDYQGARQATEYLLSLGHRRIAYLYTQTSTSIVPRRHKGYMDALQEAGIVHNPRWTRRTQDKEPAKFDFIESGRKNMQRWLREDWHELGCTALLAQNDGMALGIIEALTKEEVRVPQDVSVIGFDGTEICEYSRPRLTSVEVPLRKIGACATEMLLQQIESGNQQADTRTLPTRLRLRESCAPAKIFKK